MATDKSLRQHYDNGKIVDPFKKGFETIAGKGADVKGAIQKGFAPKTKEEKTGTFDLGAIAKSQAKSAIKNRIQSAVLSKMGLSFLNPYIGLASLFGYRPSDLMQGFAPGLKLGQKQTQAQYEAARAARQTQARIDNLLSRKSAGKTYSQKNLNELTMGSKPGFYGNVPTVSRINLAKHLIDMPEHLGDRGSISPPPTGLVNPIQQARDEVAAKAAVTTAKNPIQMARDAKQAEEDALKELAYEDAKAKAAKDAADKAAADRAAKSRQAALEAISKQIGASRGNGGGQGGGYGGSGQGAPGGEGGWKGAKGGHVDRPLPGRNRYL